MPSYKYFIPSEFIEAGKLRSLGEKPKNRIIHQPNRLVCYYFGKNVERASWEDLTPEEAIGRSIYKVKEEAIKEIKAAKKETSILSYKMLIAGALFGFLGSFLVATILNFWGYTTLGLCGDILLVVVGFIAFFGCIFFVGSVLKQIKGADR